MHRDDLVDQTIRRACDMASEAGELTFDQMDALLPADRFSPEQVEDVFIGLAARGLRLVEKWGQAGAP